MILDTGVQQPVLRLQSVRARRWRV